MIRTRFMLFVVLAGIPAAQIFAESAEHAYKEGSRAEGKNDYDAAFEGYKQAHFE